MSSLKRGFGQKRVADSDDDFMAEKTPMRSTRARLNFEDDIRTGDRPDGDLNTDEMIKEMDAVLNNPCELGNIRISGGRSSKFHSMMRYSNKEFHDILSKAPAGEEAVLREKSFDMMLHQGMTNIFRGGYSFLLVVERFKQVLIDWREKAFVMKEMKKNLKAVELELEEQRKKAREYMLVIGDRDGHIRFLEGENEKLTDNLTGTREYVGDLIDMIEKLTNQLGYAYGKYKETGEYRESLMSEFCRGVEVCREQVAQRYKDLDLKWLDGGVRHVAGSGVGGGEGGSVGTSSEGEKGPPPSPEI